MPKSSEKLCKFWQELGNLREFPKTSAEGLAQWLRSLPPNPEVPSSIPGLVEGWIFGWPSFPLKFTQLSILTGSVKWVPAYMDWFEAAATCAYICFRSAGGKLIIVKRLWACYMEKALYKCTTLLSNPFLRSLNDLWNFWKTSETVQKCFPDVFMIFKIFGKS